MIKNNIEVDVNIKCIEAGKTQRNWAKRQELQGSMSHHQKAGWCCE